jgi:hypothetical protein
MQAAQEDDVSLTPKFSGQGEPSRATRVESERVAEAARQGRLALPANLFNWLSFYLRRYSDISP